MKMRMPSIPLITVDPYFSVWTDNINSKPTTHWTAAENNIIGYVTIDGVKCPILGVICMDQVVVDLTEVPQAQEGTVGIIYGDGTNNTMSIQEACELAGSNKNEIVARILTRPPRVYVK